MIQPSHLYMTFCIALSVALLVMPVEALGQSQKELRRDMLQAIEEFARATASAEQLGRYCKLKAAETLRDSVIIEVSQYLSSENVRKVMRAYDSELERWHRPCDPPMLRNRLRTAEIFLDRMKEIAPKLDD